MSGDLSSPRREAAALKCFINDVAGFAGDRGWPRFHTRGGAQFKEFVAKAAKATAEALELWASSDEPDEPLRLAAVRNFWRTLHAWVKPSADADTHWVPVSIVGLLENVARTAEERAAMVVLHAAEFNYFHHRQRTFRVIYQQLRELIPGLPEFPAQLCFVGIPYSQGRHYLTNLCLFHELGHYAADREGFTDSIRPEIARRLRATFPNANDQARAWLAGLLERWAEELFCDLCACAAIGPAYLFAFAEAMSLMGLLDPSQLTSFGESHPAVGFRLALQRELLDECGWWGAVKQMEAGGISSYCRLANEASNQPAGYRFEPEPGQSLPVIKDFASLSAEVVKAVKRTAWSDPQPAIEAFRRGCVEAGDCLASGIVPSAVFEADADRWSATLGLVNACAYFQVARLDRLTDAMEREGGARLVEHWARCLAKAEEWSLKAAENLVNLRVGPA